MTSRFVGWRKIYDGQGRTWIAGSRSRLAVFGGRDDQEKEVTILGRVVRCSSRGMESEADQKHSQLAMQIFGFDEHFSNSIKKWR